MNLEDERAGLLCACREHGRRQRLLLLRHAVWNACARAQFAECEQDVRNGVRQLWEKSEQGDAIELVVASHLKTSAKMPLGLLRKPPPKWVSGTVELIQSLTAPPEGPDLTLLIRLKKCDALSPILARLPPPSPQLDAAGALAYWSVRMALYDDVRSGETTASLTSNLVASHATAVRELASWVRMTQSASALSAAAAPEGSVVKVVVSGAGVNACNGTYVLDGKYHDASRFVHTAGQLWLIRYRLPSGNPCARSDAPPVSLCLSLCVRASKWMSMSISMCMHMRIALVLRLPSTYIFVIQPPPTPPPTPQPRPGWYIADKDHLQSNDGDYYRVQSDSLDPPTTDWVTAQDGQRFAGPAAEQLRTLTQPCQGHGR